jgi:membrane-bound lytic murein transglycosylase B
LLSRIEHQFGVPATLIMAIWTMETDNGTGDMGKLPVVRTLATLAHDCRRTELFQGELIAALHILQRGDRHSVPDVLASTANLLKVNGWRAGAPFGPGTQNFEVMHEWNHAEIYRKALVLFSDQLRQ